MKLYTRAHKVLDRLIQIAISQRFFMSHSRGNNKCFCDRCKPGALIEKASKEDRDALKELKSDDIKDEKPLGEDV